jgi:16S rRNA (guanine527-N7)-methyltransferase
MKCGGRDAALDRSVDTSDYSHFSQWLHAAAEALGLEMDPRQVERMYEHLNLVLLANEDFNLTSLTDVDEAAVRLVADSLAILPWTDKHVASQASVSSADTLSVAAQHSVLSTQDSLRVLDMGTGAGYPAIPVAICRPDWAVTAIDPSGKKIQFVAQVAAQLGLGNLLAEQVQAREWHGRVDPFDLVITRAMGDLSICIREGGRLTAPGGFLVSYHAADMTPKEAKAADRMLHRYKMQQVDTFEYTLPGPTEAVTRRLIVIGRQPLAA